MDGVNHRIGFADRTILDQICDLNWSSLDRQGITAVGWAYYYFSIQFRENLMVAYRLYPGDLLKRLVQGECDTDNLSPWPGVVEAGEKVNHDEFMRRLLDLAPIEPATRQRIEEAGASYLAQTRAEDDVTKASCIASYEDGGLECLFTALLACQCWDTPLLAAFRHFLVRHIGFDSNPEGGHGALARHLAPDARVDRLWRELYTLFIIAEPRLSNTSQLVPNIRQRITHPQSVSLPRRFWVPTRCKGT
jgi:hypothetical protein